MMPTGRRGGPQPPLWPRQGMLSPTQTRYSQRGQMDRDGLSRREAHEDPGEGRGHVWVNRRDTFTFRHLLPPLPPAISPCSCPQQHFQGVKPPPTPFPGASPWKHPQGSAVAPSRLAPRPHPLLLAEARSPHGPQGLQYSPSAQEHRSLRGCQAHPRRKENIEGSAPEGRREQL